MKSQIDRVRIDEIEAGAPMNEPRASFSSKLQCAFCGWRVIADGELALELPEMNYPGMAGAIEIATKVMPSVFRILVYAGNDLDMEYHGYDGKWKAFDPKLKQHPRQKRNPMTESEELLLYRELGTLEQLSRATDAVGEARQLHARVAELEASEGALSLVVEQQDRTLTRFRETLDAIHKAIFSMQNPLRCTNQDVECNSGGRDGRNV